MGVREMGMGIWECLSNIIQAEEMQRRQRPKESQKTSMNPRSKLGSPTLSIKPKLRTLPMSHPLPHTALKHSKQTSKSIGNSLFNSVQELPRPRKSRSKQRPQKIEDSTASRDLRHLQKYDHPNGEYFGSRKSSHCKRKKGSSDGKASSRSKHSNKAVQSLERKMGEYRRLDSHHKSESESLKSEASEKQMRRLRKLQSLQKMQLMEDILSLQAQLRQKRR